MSTSLPASARREVLREYGRRHHLRYFIETGTNTGDTPCALVDDFDHLYTIELDPDLWAAAVVRFGGCPVTCLHGDSAEMLPVVLTRIDEPALVWLDGHHSGFGSARGQLSTPVRAELLTLFGDGRRHVILVDDARIFKGGSEHDREDYFADYPSLRWVRDLARRHGYAYELIDDIIRLVPR